jgi:transcriptional regulator with XRE-family HTH domain
MDYATEHIARALKGARQGKGMSQRALATLAGVPQSHISKIESGAVDLRLSSLVELARALDLEVTLVPRKKLSAVQSIVRSTEGPAPRGAPAPSSARALQKLQASVHVALREYPSVKELAQLQSGARDLQRMAGSQALDLRALREAIKAVQRFTDSASQLNELRRSVAEIQRLRNSIVHDVPRVGAVKPAYSLEDADDG